MIELYTGTPGSGKSLHVADLIKRYLEIYRCPVICNFEFKAYMCNCKGYGSFFYVPNQKITVDFLIKFSEKYKEKRKQKRLKEESILLVIDEAQIIFNSRNWQGPGRLEWISFFSQHRKLGYHVILVAQFDEMLDKQIRPLIEYENNHRKVSNIGFGGKLFSLFAGGKLHISIKTHYATGLVIGREFFKGNERLYQLYDSYTRFENS